MLVLTRKKGQSIQVGNDIKITVLGETNGSVKIGVEAPRELGVDREEIYLKKLQESQSSR